MDFRIDNPGTPYSFSADYKEDTGEFVITADNGLEAYCRMTPQQVRAVAHGLLFLADAAGIDTMVADAKVIE